MPPNLAKKFLRDGSKDIKLLRRTIAEVRTLSRVTAIRSSIAPSAGLSGGSREPEKNYIATGNLTIVGTDLFYSPRGGNSIWMYNADDTSWVSRPINEMTLDLSAYTTDKRYDVFYGYDAATDSDVMTTIMWTNQTTRSEPLVVVDGVELLASDTSLRYLGDFWYPATGNPIISQPFGDVSWGGTVNGGASGNIPMLADASGKVIINSGINVALYTDTKDPTGWVDPSAVTVTYDKTARTITLTGTLEYYWHGVKTTLTSPWVSDAHSASNGEYYLYAIDGVTFAWSASVWLFSYAMIAKAIYGASDKFGLREPHGMMPWQVHQAIHSKLGAWRDSGGLITAGTYTENTASDAATTPGWDAAVMYDEDIPTTIAAWAQGTYTTLRIGASSVPTYDTAASFPFRSSGSYILINDPLTGGETAGTNNRYVNVYTILVPTTADAADSQKYRTMFLQPQTQYTSLAAAQAENPYGLNLGTLEGSLPEIVFNCRVTYVLASGDGNTGKCRIATGGITYVIANGVSVTGSGGVPTHDIAGTAHTSSATSGRMLQANASGLPVDATNTDAQVAAAVTASHAAVTVLDSSRIDLGLTGQQITADIVANSVTAAYQEQIAANTIRANPTAATANESTLALTANTLPARSSTGNIAAKAVSDFGLSLIDDADNTAARATLGLGSMATETATNYVAKSLYDAQTILAATLDNTPAAVTLGTNTLLGRDELNIQAITVTAPVGIIDGILQHSTASGYVHIPAAGSSTQILQWSSSGTAKWITLSGITIADGGAMAIGANQVALSMLATQAANTVLANATAGAAVPTAFAIAASRLLGRDASGNIAGQTVGGGIEFTAGGIQTSAFTGDVTKAAGGTATTIANDAVTNAKLADASANSFIANITASAANPTYAALAASQFFARAATGNVEAKTITDAALNFLTGADASALRTLLGISAASYTPTVTPVTNLASASGTTTYYFTAGAFCLVGSTVAADPTATGACELGISLPFASNFANIYECVGFAVIGATTPPTAAQITADTTNDRAKMTWVAADTSNRTWSFMFMYRII
jgi:hypothetical protein